MTTFQEAFKTAFKTEMLNAWTQNFAEVFEAANQPLIPIWLNKKIENEAVFGHIGSAEHILNELRTQNRFAARLFCKDPLKQNFAEQFQLNWIKTHGIPDIGGLSSGGKNALYLSDGELKTGLKNKPTGSNATKSFDFRSDAHDMWCYAKYTNEEGGAQDNQHADGLRFIEQAVNYMKKNPESMTKWIFIADGAYYNDVRRAHVRQVIPPDFQDRINIYTSVELCQTITA